MPAAHSWKLDQRSAFRGHGLMHCGEKRLVVKRYRMVHRPGLYRRVSHRSSVVSRNYDDARWAKTAWSHHYDFEAA